ncbi:HAAS signaling domain-containing protein [Domibacillus robiginosus]|uniref:HAAS signaling domain-containing protein n=1 Tax=Domibacillus robiginosus TaxID=1071054 RepID=UPI001FE0DECA|nr:hypothetical protein [Domibacillus robiginosus]
MKLNLIDVYVYEVTKRLPQKTRDDIALELRSAIEDTLPERPAEEEVKAALSKLGDPALLAASYRDTPAYLIGPNVYDAYIQTLKLVIPWAIFVTIFIHIAESIVSFSGAETTLFVAIKTFSTIIASVIMVLIQVLFWFTLVFCVIERAGAIKGGHRLITSKTFWTPDDLKNIDMIPKKKAISNGEVVFGFVWTIAWGLVYFNADHLVGIYRSEGSGELQFVMPIFNQGTLQSFWLIIVAFILLDLGLALYKGASKKWTMRLAYVNAVIHGLGLVAFVVIASDPNLMNGAIIPYMAELLETTSSSVTQAIEWIWRLVAAGFVVSTIMEIIDSYRKARM